MSAFAVADPTKHATQHWNKKLDPLNDFIAQFNDGDPPNALDHPDLETLEAPN
jgi:hypothetical protein